MLSTEAALVPRLKIVLPQPVRYFVRNGFQLSHTGRCLGKNAVIKLGPIERLWYNHRDQDTVGFIGMDDCEYYFVLDEIPLVDLREKLIRLEKQPRFTVVTIITPSEENHEND